MQIRTVDWQENKIKIINQTKLPLSLEYIYLGDLKSLHNAIKTMQVRGAPALGAAAALGVYLGIKDLKARDFFKFNQGLKKIIKYLASSRPTARNLFWALERMRNVVTRNKEKPVAVLKKLLFQEAKEIIEEDRATCRRIGDYGLRLIQNNDAILTICNAGILATIDYGTALGVVYKAKEEGKKVKVYACETRPMLQGARLTTWELKKKGICVTLICDSMAARLMQQGKIKKVITGADRIALNGDAANKIGTYNLAVLCAWHKIPFYIAAPSSTFDLKMNSGKEVPIEERPAREVTELFFKQPIATRDTKVFNPAFDVTDHDLITAFITDKGIIKPPYRKNIKKVLSR